MKSVFFRATVGSFIFLSVVINAYALEVSLTNVGNYAVSFNVSQIEYSPRHQLLFLREDTAIHVIDINTGVEIQKQFATEKFTDMDLTSDSNYLFAADYGGEVMGYGNPIRPHWVHRYDLTARTWKIAQAPKIAWKIEAVSADRVLLQEHDQWIDITLNSFGDTVTELYRIGADYYGDMEYDPKTGRIYHGNSGSSSREINVYKVVGDTLTSVQGTGIYGTAQNGGGTSVLSTDGFYFYYGPLQVEAMNVTNNTRTFPEIIYAASDRIAFGQNKYYYADTGAELGTLGLAATVYGISEDGKHLWAFKPAGQILYHYTIGGTAEKRLIDLTVSGPAAVGYEDTAQFTATALYMDGSEENVTTRCTWSIDRSIFGSIDNAGVLTTVNRPGTIIVTASYTELGRTISKNAIIECIPNFNENGVDELEYFTLNTAVSQIEYSPKHKLLCLRQGESAILIVDANSRRIIDTHLATEKFTDMDLTSDSNYLFVADYGGEATGYGTPLRPHWVHRYDLTARTWKIAQAPKIAWKIEAVSADRVLLQEHDQWIDITLNRFGDTVTELSRISADYYGDMEYDPKTGRIYHGNSGSSSREINVYKVVGDALTSVQGTGGYGTAQNGGGTCVLSTNGKYLFYGRLETDAMNVQTNLRFLTQTIYAAADKIAFGDSRFYDAETGEELSGLGFSSTVYGVSEDGRHLWAYQSQGNLLHHYLIEGPQQNAAPEAKIQGGDRVVEADGPQGATVRLDGSSSSDADSTPGTNDDIKEFNWYEKTTDGSDVQTIRLAAGPVVNVPLSLGQHSIVLEVIDSQGAIDDCEVNIIVKDTVPPEFNITASPTTIWPPNRRMVPIVTRCVISDNCDDNPKVSLLSVEIKEDQNDLTLTNQADVNVDAEGNIFLRAARSGNCAGRIYTLNFQAVDDYANTTFRTVKIIVPHDQRKVLYREPVQLTK